MARRFTDWLSEVRAMVKDRFHIDMETMTEYDIQDARSYYNEGSPPQIYFDECLAEYGDDGEEIKEILKDE